MNIFFFGDSISFGQGISIDLTWVTQIAVKLRQQYPMLDINVNNTSINGNTTRMALERMPYDVQSHDVDILLVGFGMNDCNYWLTDKGIPRVSPLAFEANMKEIIDRGFHFGAKEIILRTNHPSSKKDLMINNDFTYADSNAKYNEIIRQIVKEDKRVRFVDIEKIFLKYCEKENTTIEKLTLSDGVHLSLEGHQVYLEAVYPVLEKAIQSIGKKE